MLDVNYTAENDTPLEHITEDLMKYWMYRTPSIYKTDYLCILTPVHKARQHHRSRDPQHLSQMTFFKSGSSLLLLIHSPIRCTIRFFLNVL